MADGRGVPEGKEPAGSQTNDAGNPALARGGAGAETGAQPQVEGSDSRGDLEERRETEQVPRSTSDGMGEGMVKDQG